MKYRFGNVGHPPARNPISATRLYPYATLEPIAMSVSMSVVRRFGADQALR